MANIAVKKNEGLGKRAGKFLRESWLELRKASWPTSDELKKSTLVVLAAIGIMVVWVGGLDELFGLITKGFVGW